MQHIMPDAGKKSLTIFAAALAMHMAGCVWACPVLAQGTISSIEQGYVSNPLTGVAIDGFDPVAFFTDGEPVPGNPAISHDWAGLPWYFTSEANRDIFARSPEVYAPQMGGYCAMGLARGFLSEGNPRLWAILGNRLFFFYSTGNRDAFLLAPGTAYAKAEVTWAQKETILASR